MNMPASLVDAVIAFTVMEFVILVWRHQRTGRGLGAVELAGVPVFSPLQAARSARRA